MKMHDFYINKIPAKAEIYELFKEDKNIAATI